MSQKHYFKGSNPFGNTKINLERNSMIKVKSYAVNHRHIYTAIGGGSPSVANDTLIDLVCLVCGKTKSIIVGNDMAQTIFRNVEKDNCVILTNDGIRFYRRDI